MHFIINDNNIGTYTYYIQHKYILSLKLFFFFLMFKIENPSYCYY